MTNEKNSITIIFGKNVKSYRKKKKMTQDTLGEKVGVSTKHISNIECGVSFPSSSIISQIASTLEIEPYMLFVPEEITGVEPYGNYVSKDAMKKELMEKLGRVIEEI